LTENKSWQKKEKCPSVNGNPKTFARHVKCDYILKGSKESVYSNELIEVIDMFDESQMITLVKVLKAVYEMGVY
jgi:hypothetical protein